MSNSGVNLLQLIAFSGIADAYDSMHLFTGKLLVFLFFGLVAAMIFLAGKAQQTIFIILQAAAALLALLSFHYSYLPFGKPDRQLLDDSPYAAEIYRQDFFIAIVWYVFVASLIGLHIYNARLFEKQVRQY